MIPNEIIIGIDEAGRGPVFGPMVVGGSCNLYGWSHPEVKDSKQVRSEKKRRELAAAISRATIWSTATITVDAINTFGTARSLKTAGLQVAKEIVERLQKKNLGRPIRVIFDGNDHADCVQGDCQYQSIVKADSTIFEVSCASLLAKVLHDDLIDKLVASDAKYGNYSLAKNKGYPTPEHKVGLLKFGITDQHRRVACNTFLGTTNGTACEAPQK